MKVCTQVHGSKISMVFTKGQKSLKPFQNSCLFNNLRTIRLEQLIIYENQSNLTEVGKNNTVLKFCLSLKELWYICNGELLSKTILLFFKTTVPTNPRTIYWIMILVYLKALKIPIRWVLISRDPYIKCITKFTTFLIFPMNVSMIPNVRFLIILYWEWVSES